MRLIFFVVICILSCGLVNGAVPVKEQEFSLSIKRAVISSKENLAQQMIRDEIKALTTQLAGADSSKVRYLQAQIKVQRDLYKAASAVIKVDKIATSEALPDTL